MKKLCRNCESFVLADGKKVCKYLNVERTDTDNPPPESSCWTKRPKLSGEALSIARATAGRKGGGRPKGSGKGRAPTKQVSLHLMDYNALFAYAALKGKTLVGVVHLLCKSLITKYPQIKPSEWVD